ncbi:hypothetical protein [Treponema pectinovorum]|uniref:hypothetical protein n=1 Tax=Treponema pectinovorum TaxID=164 RepID=UPI0011C84474|nr:hypothetical protein [Treponema pectinovorum]
MGLFYFHLDDFLNFIMGGFLQALRQSKIGLFGVPLPLHWRQATNASRPYNPCRCSSQARCGATSRPCRIVAQGRATYNQMLTVLQKLSVKEKHGSFSLTPIKTTVAQGRATYNKMLTVLQKLSVKEKHGSFSLTPIHRFVSSINLYFYFNYEYYGL